MLTYTYIYIYTYVYTNCKCREREGGEKEGKKKGRKRKREREGEGGRERKKATSSMLVEQNLLAFLFEQVGRNLYLKCISNVKCLSHSFSCTLVNAQSIPRTCHIPDTLHHTTPHNTTLQHSSNPHVSDMLGTTRTLNLHTL